VQLYWVLRHGTWPTDGSRRAASTSTTAPAPAVASLLRKMGIDDGREQAVVLRSFVSSGPLENYARRVQLLSD